MNKFSDSLWIVDAKNLCTCIYDGIECLDAGRDSTEERVQIKQRILDRLQELKDIINNNK